MWSDRDLKGPFLKYRDILTKYGCSDEDIAKLQSMWNEPHRVYHNQEHLDEIISLIENWKSPTIIDGKMTETEFDLFILTAIFHDAIYDPRAKSGENELNSAELFLKMCPKAAESELNPQGNPYKSVSDFVYGMILDTKDHTQEPSSTYSRVFLEYDLHGMINGSLSRMISDEAKIMREYGFVDYETYHNVRGTQFLEKFAPHIKKLNPNSKVEEYLDWYKNRTPNIAIFAGSFYPFHKGHLDILKRAERIFDKVIVLLCVNPGKNNNSEHVKGYIINELRGKLPNNQIEFFDGMLHNYIKKLSYPVSIVKGLRNASDFDSEKLQLRYMEDMCPDINIVYIVSDRKYEHISSSGIKQIQSMGALSEAKEYLI